MDRALCLYMPYLSTDRAGRAPVPAGDESRPLVLTRPSGSSVLVAQVCPRAARAGLRPGMTLAQARALVPGLRVLPADPARDRALLHELATWAGRFGPTVQPVEPGTLLVDVSGCGPLFRGEQNIVRQAAEGLAQRGLTARAAIADTIGAAYALASAADLAPTAPPNAADQLPRASWIVVPRGQTRAFLAPLPPAALRIESRVVEQLEALGVRTIADLLALPRASLAARFGAELALRLRQALGETFEGLLPFRPPDEPAARCAFDGALCDASSIRAAAEALLAEVLDEVARRGATVRRLECVLCGERAAPVVISIGLSRGSRSPRHLGELLGRRLEQVDLTPGVCGIELRVSRMGAWSPAQGDLFGGRPTGQEEVLARLIDRIADRLGWGAVLRPRLIDDHQPEMAFRYVSLAEAPEDDARTTPHAAPRPARPLRLLSPPVPIRVRTAPPDGPPARVSLGGREQRVVHAAGPERIETAWWRGADVRRDYFRLTCENGEQWWVFRELNRGAWYLHGVFT